jgi:hypothetical protein
MASMWNKGTELGMKMFTEPIKRLQLMQQLLTSLASQLICLNISSEVWLMVEQLLNIAILAFLKSQLLKLPDKLKCRCLQIEHLQQNPRNRYSVPQSCHSI